MKESDVRINNGDPVAVEALILALKSKARRKSDRSVRDLERKKKSH